jgi:hypothetical protein
MPRSTEHIEFYSDTADPLVPTVRLEGTIEPDHATLGTFFGCNKTLALMNR